MQLLKDSRANWYGKKAFSYLYWTALLPGRHLGESSMPFCGKDVEHE
jgi:sulfide:quinone oxidoreductase